MPGERRRGENGLTPENGHETMLLLRNRKDKFRGSGEHSSSGSSACPSSLSSPCPGHPWQGRTGLQPGVALVAGGQSQLCPGRDPGPAAGLRGQEGSVQSTGSPSAPQRPVLAPFLAPTRSPQEIPVPQLQAQHVGCALPRHQGGSPRTRSELKQ